MNNRIFTHDGRTFRRINARAARRAYERGEQIFACPVNLRPFGSPWTAAACIGQDVPGCYGRSFESVTCELWFYGCRDRETGLYLAYYVEDAARAAVMTAPGAAPAEMEAAA